jgi:hypothetical protein
MDKGLKHRDFTFITHHQAAEILQPGDRAFDFPATLVPSKRSSILRLALFVASVGADQFDPATLQSRTQRVRVGGFVINQTVGILSRASSPSTRHRDLLQSRFDQRDFVRRRRGKLDSDRHTRAVCHHHKLCTLSAFGFSDLGTPFFAEENVPSANTSCQSSWPASSNSARKERQASSQTSASSHSCKRRQQVLGEGYSLGKSRQRAPLRKTHRIPSNTSRLAIRFRPPFGDCLGFGNKGSIFAHCSSVNSRLYLDIEKTPFRCPFNITSCRAQV